MEGLSQMSEESKHLTPVLISLMAISGGVARYAQSYLEGQRFSLFKLIASMVVSGFSGVMFGYFGITLGLRGEIIHVFSGIGGFYGTATLHYLFDRITDGQV